MVKVRKRKGKLPPPPPNRLVSVFDDPPRKHVLLLSCMDQRLLDDTVHFMNDLNLHNRYDQLTLAGGAMGVHRLPKCPPDPSATWWNVFTDHLSTAINKLERKIKDVFLLDHLDCGAYKHLHPDCEIAKEYSEASPERMRELHGEELSALAWQVHEFCEGEYHKVNDDKWRNIRVSCFLLDLRGRVKQLEVPDSQRCYIER